MQNGNVPRPNATQRNTLIEQDTAISPPIRALSAKWRAAHQPKRCGAATVKLWSPLSTSGRERGKSWSFLDWVSDKLRDAGFSNQVRTVVALLAVPGALWGIYLFVRWMRGQGLDAEMKRLQTQNIEIQGTLRELTAQIATLRIARKVDTEVREPELVQPTPIAPLGFRNAFLSYAHSDASFVKTIAEIYNRSGNTTYFLMRTCPPVVPGKMR